MQSLVSICVPTYNGERYLAEALESIEAQTYENCEVVVSDDSSSDRTLVIVEEFAAHSKYKYRIFNHEPSGIGSNWNHCVEHARGEYIKFLFQDDLLFPECVSEMVELMEEDAAVDLVFSQRDLLISSRPTVSAITWCYMHKEPTAYWGNKLASPAKGKDLLKGRMLLSLPRNKVGEPSSIMLRTSVFERAGFFSSSLKQALDYEYWYRVFALSKVGYIPWKLSVFRVHEDQATQRNQIAKVPDNVFFNLTEQVDPALFHKDVSLMASGSRSVFSVLSSCIFYGRRFILSILVMLKILRGRQFIPS